MIRGISAATSGMLAAQAQSDSIADNIANIRTPGYKQEQAILKPFPNMLLARIDETAPEYRFQVIGPGGTGVGVDQVARSMIEGLLDKTDKSSDLALISQEQGPDLMESFFAVQTPEGERYTRNGHFHVDQSGTLRTVDGYAVLGVDGEITNLSPEFQVDRDGLIKGQDQATGKELIFGQLLIVQGPQDSFRREGQSFYSAVQRPMSATGVDVLQGTLEGSNVDLADQIEKMMVVKRAYEANQKVIQAEDSALDKAVNEVGRV